MLNLSSNKKIDYDIDPKNDKTTTKDTLLNPIDYTNKWIITNPPYLARKRIGFNLAYKIISNILLDVI